MKRPLKLHSDETEEHVRTITYLSYLREDFIDRVIRITIDHAGRPLSIYFSSNTYGTCIWNNGMGITEVNRWEDEDSVQNISGLTRHYTALLLNGQMPTEYGRTIAADVLGALPDTKVRDEIERIISVDKFDETVSAERFLSSG